MNWRITLTAFLFISTTAWAEVSQNEVAAMLDKMVKEGTISAIEAEKAKAKMKVMNGSEWSQLNGQAEKVAAERAPASIASVGTIKESKSGDLSKAQFSQIEDDIKKIMPAEKQD